MVRASVAILVLLHSSHLFAAQTPAPGIAWRTDAKEAMRESADLERPLLIYWHAEWCIPCKLMEESTYRDADVLSAAVSFVALKVDADAFPTLARRYAIVDLPTILILDGSEREIIRLAGLVAGPPLAAALLDVSRGYARYRIDRAKRDGAGLRAAAGYLLDLGNIDAAAGLLDEAFAMTPKAQVVLRDNIELDRTIVELLRNNVQQAGRRFDRLANSTDPATQQRALIGLLVSAHASKNERDRDRAMRLLARIALGVEIPEGDQPLRRSPSSAGEGPRGGR